MKTLNGKYVIGSEADLQAVEDKFYPNGIESARLSRPDDDMFGIDGAYIGFNLCRYLYVERMAAEIHAMRDQLNGLVGYSYGMPFNSYVMEHENEKDGKYYEVWTG